MGSNQTGEETSNRTLCVVFHYRSDYCRVCESLTKMDDDVYRFIVKPVLILLGMIVAGAIIDSQLHTNNAFTLIFAIFGGIPAIGLYFKKEVFDK